MPKAQANKSKIRQMGQHQPSKRRCVKGHIQQTEKAHCGIREIFTDHVADEGPISEYIKKSYSSITSTTKTSNNLIKIRRKDLRRYFSKHDIQRDNKHEKMLNITS